MKPLMEFVLASLRRSHAVRLFAERILGQTTSMPERFPSHLDGRPSVTLSDFIRDPSPTMRQAERAPVEVRDTHGVLQMTISVPTDRRPIPND